MVFLLPFNATHCHTFYEGMRWKGEQVISNYQILSTKSVLRFFNSSIFWKLSAQFLYTRNPGGEPNFCFKIFENGAAIRYSPFFVVCQARKTCRKHCLMGEICSNCLLCCMMMAVSLARNRIFRHAPELASPAHKAAHSSVCHSHR